MSNINSSLAFEEIEEQLEETVELSLLSRHLSISNAISEKPSACQTIKVYGNITISF